MSTISEEAQSYEPPKTKNITDLESVPTDIAITDETHTKTNEDGSEEEFTIKVIDVEGVKYRVPISVLKNLKAILEEKPDLKTFKVKKSGSGMNTAYTVVSLEETETSEPAEAEEAKAEEESEEETSEETTEEASE